MYYLFRDIRNYGLKKYCSLKRSEVTSISSSIAMADLDFDGQEEILIGNSSKVLKFKLLLLLESDIRLQDFKKYIVLEFNYGVCQ